jgi:hypothetical protein
MKLLFILQFVFLHFQTAKRAKINYEVNGSKYIPVLFICEQNVDLLGYNSRNFLHLQNLSDISYIMILSYLLVMRNTATSAIQKVKAILLYYP